MCPSNLSRVVLFGKRAVFISKWKFPIRIIEEVNHAGLTHLYFRYIIQTTVWPETSRQSRVNFSVWMCHIELKYSFYINDLYFTFVYSAIWFWTIHTYHFADTTNQSLPGATVAHNLSRMITTTVINRKPLQTVHAILYTILLFVLKYPKKAFNNA